MHKSSKKNIGNYTWLLSEPIKMSCAKSSFPKKISHEYNGILAFEIRDPLQEDQKICLLCILFYFVF